jgi:hypothetical protein
MPACCAAEQRGACQASIPCGSDCTRCACGSCGLIGPRARSHARAARCLCACMVACVPFFARAFAAAPAGGWKSAVGT